MADPATVLRAAADLLDPPPWEPKGRPPLEPHQIPPESFDFWLLEGGRGSGKTEACARYFARYMNEHMGCRGRIIAPTLGDAVRACVKGPSGLESIDPTCRMVTTVGGTVVKWPNGSEALLLGAHTERDVDRLRAAGNAELDWLEEAAAMRWLSEAWDQAELGRRIGRPHVIASTTPKATSAYKRVRDFADVRTHASMEQNPHLDQHFKAVVTARYSGTRLGKQEIEGLLLEDTAGALWSRQALDYGRITAEQLPDLVAVAVAIDPAATSKPGADDTGIIVAGRGADGHGYVLDDRTCHLAPDGWARRALRAYEAHDADRIIGEVNNGGEMVEAVIRAADDTGTAVFQSVTASRGKATRAQPIAALFGNPPSRPPTVHMVGSFPELEDQLCNWVPGDADSPDRLDAMVWALTDLMLGEQSSWRPL